LIAIVLNIFIAFHLNEGIWIIGNLPVMYFFYFRLSDNQNDFLKTLELENEPGKQTFFDKLARFILKLHPFLQTPFLAIIALPVLFVLSTILMLFGQKPDSIVRSFTDTYKHGFSQLDYQCKGVVCDGHYLCTIAPRGHTGIVKPLRYGARANQTIVCNRQLLISNAFEELLQERLPWFHRPIRKCYNRIGNSIHRHYWLFKYKLVSDLIYILMKPLEWFFLCTLYLFDHKPENRIARQYDFPPGVKTPGTGGNA